MRENIGYHHPCENAASREPSYSSTLARWEGRNWLTGSSDLANHPSLPNSKYLLSICEVIFMTLNIQANQLDRRFRSAENCKHKI